MEAEESIFTINTQEGKSLRVERGLLMISPVFRDMLSMPQPSQSRQPPPEDGTGTAIAYVADKQTITLPEPYGAVKLMFDLLRHPRAPGPGETGMSNGWSMEFPSDEDCALVGKVFPRKYEIPFLYNILIGIIYEQRTFLPREILRISCMLDGQLPLAKTAVKCMAADYTYGRVHPARWRRKVMAQLGYKTWYHLVKASYQAGLYNMMRDPTSTDWVEAAKHFNLRTHDEAPASYYGHYDDDDESEDDDDDE